MRKNGPNASTPKGRRAPWPPSRRLLRKLVEQAIVDAWGESEQRTGFFTMIEEHLSLPFITKVLGVTVTVERVDLTVADDILAICRRGSKRQSIPILDLPLPQPPPSGAQWIEAYRLWVRGA